MKYGQCAKCGLTLPIYLLTVIILKSAQGKKKVLICQTCKKTIERQSNKNAK